MTKNMLRAQCGKAIFALCHTSAAKVPVFSRKSLVFASCGRFAFFMYEYKFAVAFRGRFRKRWNERLSRASSSTPVRVEVAVAQNVVARISQVSVFLAAAGLGG